jgi:hypothetical protein
MDGKITIELDYTICFDNEVRFSHPDLQGHLSMKSSSARLSQIQIDNLNLAKPTTAIDGIVSDGQDLLEAVEGLKQLVPEIIAVIKERKPWFKEKK